MTKLDYLSSLERYLKRQIPEEEIYEIMRDILRMEKTREKQRMKFQRALVLLMRLRSRF